MKQTISAVLLAIFIAGCSHFSEKEKLIIAKASNTRLQIELGDKPASSKNDFLYAILNGGTTMKEFERLLTEDWRIKWEEFGKADDSDHRPAGCMHVYGICKLKDDKDVAWETLQFYFPGKK